MKKPYFNFRILNIFITSLLSASGFAALVLWLNVSPAVEIEPRIPAAVLETAGAAPSKTDIRGYFTAFDGQPASFKGEWGGFRGPARDNVSREDIPLRGSLDENDLPVLWSVKLGEGYAGPAVGNGMVYVIDYDTEKNRDTLRAFSLEDGREVWRRGYEVSLKRNHGYSRTVPAVSDGYVVSIGPRGHVMCVEALTGSFKWGIDLEREYGASTPPWYTGQCPLIDDGTAVIAPAGEALLIGVDISSGEVLWETPNPGEYSMSHSSVIPMSFHGKKMYVYCAVGGMTGISAEGEDRGRILWQTDEWTQSVIVPSPVELPENRVLVTAGYGAGSALFAITEEEGEFRAEKLYSMDRSVLASEQQTPIYYRGSIYSVLPYDAGEFNRQLVRAAPDGSRVWSSGRETRFGLGPFIIADGKIYILDNNGVLTVAEAESGRYRQLGQARVLEGKESWGPIAVSGGRMLLRDFETLICLDMRKESE